MKNKLRRNTKKWRRYSNTFYLLLTNICSIGCFIAQGAAGKAPKLLIFYPIALFHISTSPWSHIVCLPPTIFESETNIYLFNRFLLLIWKCWHHFDLKGESNLGGIFCTNRRRKTFHQIGTSYYPSVPTITYHWIERNWIFAEGPWSKRNRNF